MLKRYPIIAFALSVLLTAYSFFALSTVGQMAREDSYVGCKISIADSAHTDFVSVLEVSRECNDIMQWIKNRKRSEVSLYDIEKKLRKCDKIETVNVYTTNNGMLNIDVTPMVPVARVFDDDLNSYYINATGKKISNDIRFHVDVPVVVGSFPEQYPATRLLPLLEYISADPQLDALVSTVKQEEDGNIIIIPTIRGHVVNFGDTSGVASKFARLLTFYRQVAPARGWETYDTVTVKWRGRVIGTLRDKTLAHTALPTIEDEFSDIDDSETMSSPTNSDTTFLN